MLYTIFRRKALAKSNTDFFWMQRARRTRAAQFRKKEHKKKEKN